LFGIGFDPCGALLDGPAYPFGRGCAAGSLEAMAMSMMLSCLHPPRSMRLRYRRRCAELPCRLVVCRCYAVDGVFDGLGQRPEAKGMELDVRSVSKKVGVEPSNTSRAGMELP
jgi:hypothetical protein